MSDLTEIEERIIALTGVDRAAFLRTKGAATPPPSPPNADMDSFLAACLHAAEPAEDVALHHSGHEWRPIPDRRSAERPGETIVFLGPIAGLKSLW